MPKIITGKVLVGFEPVDNNVWGTPYMRKRTVIRRSHKVKAINVCLIARKKLGEPLPATIAKTKYAELWNQGPEGKKAALSAAFSEVLNECKNNARKYCEKAAANMGLSVDECTSLLSSIGTRGVSTPTVAGLPREEIARIVEEYLRRKGGG